MTGDSAVYIVMRTGVTREEIADEPSMRPRVFGSMAAARAAYWELVAGLGGDESIVYFGHHLIEEDG